ncbi:MAG: hypothetical protein CMQ52_05195 [Gammaproteobacteria bacterium]|mgnify:FL=1|nr:hypothetical protein [Gammaproteobacteria bacterium]MDG1509647.1 hypothetical protein [Flavobacteriaceae bacterium]MDG2275474.1 hypothetical protein [Flavobacteriaceae bacterium]
MIEDDFIKSIPNELVSGADFILDKISKFHQDNQNNTVEFYQTYIEFSALLEAFLLSYKYPFKKIDLDLNKEDNILKIMNFSHQIKLDLSTMSKKRLVHDSSNIYKAPFQYPFSQAIISNELDKTQLLINELREVLSMSSVFGMEHKSRLLRQLGNLNRNYIRSFLKYSSLGVL